MKMNEIIRKRRYELGLTMAQVAMSVGVSEPTDRTNELPRQHWAGGVLFCRKYTPKYTHT